jgi:hypothetical protein
MGRGRQKNYEETEDFFSHVTVSKYHFENNLIRSFILSWIKET